MIKKNKPIYIMSFEGKDIVRQKYSLNTNKLKKKNLFSVSLPFSLDIIKLIKEYPEEMDYIEQIEESKNKSETNKTKSYIKKKQMTTAFVNVKFEYSNKEKTRNNQSGFDCQSYIDGLYSIFMDAHDDYIDCYNDEHGIAEARDLAGIRRNVYANGFEVDGIEYVLYKRSSAKARESSCLFIKKDCYDKMINWSRLGLNSKFENLPSVDIAALRSYEALTLSGIEDTIYINPDNILLIDDDETNEFYANFYVSEYVDGEYKTTIKELPRTNNIYDGQSLMDSSLFVGKYADKGFLLLRNRMFKSCCFNTNIYKFLKEHCPTGIVRDKFKKEYKIEDVKLITTPSSIKLFKFSDDLFGKDNEEECYDRWKWNLLRFGIVKYDKPSPFGNVRALSYQYINSLPLSKEAVLKLMQDEIQFVGYLKNDTTVHRWHINNLNLKQNHDNMYETLLSYNEKTWETAFFTDFKRDIIDNYVKHLRKGHIKIQKSGYYTVVGNGLKMLHHAGGTFQSDKLKKRQVYCSSLPYGKKLVGFRSPHISNANVLVLENVHIDEYEKYFNNTDNLVFIDSTSDEILDRASGMDMDSDILYLADNDILLEAAEKCTRYPTPLNKIKSTAKKQALTPEAMADVDSIIGDNQIGNIVNMSQLYMSTYWDLYFSENPDKEILDYIQEKLIFLSNLASIEIDKAKKLYTIETSDILKQLGSDPVLKKGGKPLFFKYFKHNGKPNAKKKDVGKYQYYNTPMDFAIEIISDIEPKELDKLNLPKNILDCMVKHDTSKTRKKRREEIINLANEIDKTRRRNAGLYNTGKLSEEVMRQKISECWQECIKQLKTSAVTPKMMCWFFTRNYSEEPRHAKEREKFGGVRRTVFKLLYESNPKSFLECFQKHDDYYKLKESPDGDIVIFGKRYIKYK